MSRAAARHAAGVLRQRLARGPRARIIAATGRVAVRLPRGADRRAGHRLGARRAVSSRRVRRAADRSPRELPPLPARAPDPQDRHRARITCSTASATRSASAERVGRELAAAPIDVAFVGIGENGHLAFNDPPADFDTEQPVSHRHARRGLPPAAGRRRLVSPRSRDVPSQAISMSVRQILKSREIVCVVPDARKAHAVEGLRRGRGLADGAGVDPADPRQHDDLSRSRVGGAARRAARGAILDVATHDDRAPGFFDLQVNGFGGVDFNAPRPDRRSRRRSARAHARDRRHALPADAHHLVVRAVRRERARARAASPIRRIAGIHMEGPYLSPEDGARGAHPREHVAPASVDDFERRQDAAGGRIVLVTLARRSRRAR